MNRIERKLLFRTLTLGVLLTATVIAVDLAGWLAPLERWLWDKRARYCQWFSPKPTDRLVHIMIDDDTLQSIGSWPWPRSVLAGVIDELTDAGARMIALDMFFPEPQRPTPEGDHDAIFARSLKRSARVLLPNSVEFRTIDPPDRLLVAAGEELEKDLELPTEDLRARLLSRGFSKDEIAARLGAATVGQRKVALLRRVEHELAATTQPAELRAKLLPRAEATGVENDAAQQFSRVLDQVMAARTLAKFGGATPPEATMPLLRADAEQAVSINLLTSEAAASGFVDLLSAEDSTVRSLPLLINYRGVLWPTMAFTLACHELGTKPSLCRLTPDGIIIPASGGDRFVPTRVEVSSKFGPIGTVFDIPWAGDDQWLGMYTSGNVDQTSAFLPLKAIWTIGQLQRDVAENDATTDEAMFALAKLYQVDDALKFLDLPVEKRTDDARAAALEAVAAIAIDDSGAAEVLKTLEAAEASTLSDDDKKYLAAALALRRGRTANKTLHEMIAHRRSELRRLVSGKVVLVGWSAAGKLDFFPTSLHTSCPGSVVQGAVFNGIVTGHVLRSRPRWMVAGITFVIGLACTLAVARLTPWQAAGTALLLAVIYALVNGFLLYDWGDQLVGAAAPLTAAGANWSLLTLSKFINETRERSRITRRFRSYVDPALVDFVIEHPERMSLEGEVREVTVAFTDLAGFTSIAENLQERAVPILNQYMGLMVPIIRRHGGLVNKFLGDGIMFFYGAPREHPGKAIAAVKTVLEMNKALGPLNAELKAKGLPLVNMRAGISTGNVVVGDAGAIEGEHQASDYTVLGDRVNLAARIEAANKAFGSAVLIEHLTFEQVREQMLVRRIGRVKVKGKEEGVLLYEPLCALADATPEQKERVAVNDAIADLYEKGQFEACQAAISAAEGKYGESKLWALYATLCQHYLQPENRQEFKGDITLMEK